MSRRRYRRDSQSSPGHSLSWHVPSIVLAIVVVASPLAIGGVHASVAAGIAILSLLGLWWALVTGGGRDRKTGLMAVSIPVVGFTVMALACLVQLIPVPTWVYRLVQPAGYEAWVTNHQVVFGADPETSWHLLSLDPRATAEHGLKWIALASVAALAGWVITDRRRRRSWLALLLVGGLIVAAVGFVQQLFGTELILGFYEAEVGVRSLSPFVSTNHAATYFGLLAVVGAAYGLDQIRRSPPKASLGASAAVLFLLLCASHGSDGALLAVAAGLAVVGLAAVRWLSASTSTLKRRIAKSAVALLFAGAVAAMFIPSDWTLAGEGPTLEDTSFNERVEMAKGAMGAMVDHPIVGTGAGSVERTISPYIDWTEVREATIPTIENEPVEWAMTLSPVVAVVAVALFAYVFARLTPHLWRRRGRRGAMTAAAVMAAMAVASLFHFPFFTLGIAVIAAVAVEACLDRRHDSLFVHTSPQVAALLLLGMTVTVFGLSAARVTVLDAGAEEDLDVTEAERVERALHLYPTDGMLMTALSLDARGEDNQRALELAQRAYQLRSRPRQQIALAHRMAVVDQSRQAAETYAELFEPDRRDAFRHFARAEERILYGLREPHLRAVALADAESRAIERFIGRIVDEEGRFPAINFCLELIELRPNRVIPHLQLIDLYERAERPLLAEIYARGLVNRDLEGPRGERPAGLRELLDLLDDQGRVDEARNMAARAFDAGRATPELARTTLSLMPNNPDEITDEEHWSLIEAAIDVGCRPPYATRNERRICWRNRALLAEHEGELDRAESLLRRVDRVEDDPRPLIAMLLRHRRCRGLAVLKRQHENSRYHSRIESALDDCVEFDGFEE